MSKMFWTKKPAFQTLDRSSSAVFVAAELTVGDAGAAATVARRAYALQRGNGRVAAVLARTLQTAEPREAEVLLAKARQLSARPLLASR